MNSATIIIKLGYPGGWRADLQACHLDIEIIKGLIFNPLFSNTGESKIMKEQKTLALDKVEVEFLPEVTSEEKNLVVLEYRPKKRIDETISKPDKYVSRYHYDSKHIDAKLELCPHCKKPTLSAFQKTVADSAMNYLLEKEEARDRRSSRRRNIGFIFGGLIFLAGIYYWVFHIISGARI